jgi:uracil-DNA glycosylase family 4
MAVAEKLGRGISFSNNGSGKLLKLDTKIYSDINLSQLLEVIKFSSNVQFTKDDLIRKMLFSSCQVLFKGNSSRLFENKKYLPGHVYGFPYFGPLLKSKIAIVGKMPGYEELASEKNFVGQSGKLLMSYFKKYCQELIADNQIYLTNILKINLSEIDNVPLDLIKAFFPILLCELRIVEPDYIIVLGKDAFRAFMGGHKKFTNHLNRFISYQIKYPDGSKYDTKLFVLYHPAQCLRVPDLLGSFEQGITKFGHHFVSSKSSVSTQEQPKYEIIKDETGLDNAFKVLEKSKEIVLDCEWHREWYDSEFFIRYIQFGGTDDNGEFKIFIVDCTEDSKLACKFVDLLLKSDWKRKKLVGHNVSSDILALCRAANVKIDEFEPLFRMPCSADIDKDAVDFIENGFFDTMIAAHAYNENIEFGLKNLVASYLNFPEYDLQLREYLEQQKMNNVEEDMEGFGFVPSHILLPYAAWDVFATYHLYLFLKEKLLSGDEYGIKAVKPFYITSSIIYPYLVAMYHGIPIDLQLVNKLSEKFKTKADEILNFIRKEINWPEFSGKGRQRIEFVYGRKSDLGFTPSSPENAKLLNFESVISSGSEDLDIYEDDETEDLKKLIKTKTVYSTSQAILAYLEIRNPDRPETEILRRFREWCLLNSITERVLRMDGKAGLLQHLSFVPNQNVPSIHPTFLPLLKTGRTSVFKPNLQNLSKKREEDYKRIFGNDYEYPVRSIIAVSVPDRCILEMDLISAELMVLAILSGDKHLFDLCYRSSLPKSDSNYVDMHSYIALKLSGRTDIKPTKESLSEHGLLWLRDASKTAIYALLYGQSKERFYFTCRNMGLKVTREETDKFMEIIAGEFPKLIYYIKSYIPELIRSNFYVLNPFGRARRFIKVSKNTDDGKRIIEQYVREGVNFVAQSSVADIISLTAGRMQKRIHEFDFDGRLILQLHDALIYEINKNQVKEFEQELLNAVRSIKLLPDNPGSNLFGEIKIYERNWGM